MPSFQVAADYVRANYEREDRLAVVLIYRDPPRVQHEFATAERIASPGYQAHLRAANASGADIYLTVNTLKPNATGRTKADIDAVRHVFLDLDGGGREAVNRILQTPGMPAPHHILNTSPEKHQLIWSVKGFAKQEAETLVRSLAAQHEADQAVWDVARVLRIPGFRNHKYEGIRHFIEDIQDQLPAAREYEPAHFPAVEPEHAPATLGAVPGEQKSTGKHCGSQSERDWATVMRALARGEDPSVIEARLERSRPDKPNPRYYAQRTISKALQEHARQTMGGLNSSATQEGERTR